MGIHHRLGALLIAASLATGCSAEPAATEAAPPVPTTTAPVPTPALQALARIPATATDVRFTDFARIKGDLGTPDLNGTSPVDERARFWRQALSQSATLTRGLLRPVDRQLRTDYAFTKDDVVWEADFTTPDGPGWILALREGVSMGSVQAAVEDGVGDLVDGEVDIAHRLVALRAVSEEADSLAADPDVAALIAPSAVSVYLSMTCVDPETALGGPLTALPAATTQTLGGTQPLDAFSITFGSTLATVRVGPGRADLNARRSLGEPPLAEPDVATAYVRGVADAQSGRIGFDLGDPALAASLVLEGRLPFAACPA